jgi:hypothetical protein
VDLTSLDRESHVVQDGACPEVLADALEAYRDHAMPFLADADALAPAYLVDGFRLRGPNETVKSPESRPAQDKCPIERLAYREA